MTESIKRRKIRITKKMLRNIKLYFKLRRKKVSCCWKCKKKKITIKDEPFIDRICLSCFIDDFRANCIIYKTWKELRFNPLIKKLE